jgi:hypothetical protein
MSKHFSARRRRKRTAKPAHLSTYKNTMTQYYLFGAEKAGVALTPSYELEMKKCLDSFEKETKQAKVIGDLDEENAKPILWAMFVQICHWALLHGNVFVWVFSVLQWNCLGRSVSINPLGFHNLRPGPDSIVVEYDSSKANQEAAKVTPKNCYTQSFLPLLLWEPLAT